MKKILFILSFFLILHIPYIVHAEDVYNIIDETEEINAPSGFSVSDTAKDIADGKLDLTFAGVADKLLQLLIGEIKNNFDIIKKMTAIALISGAVANLGDGKNEIGAVACASAAGILSLKTFGFALEYASETCDSLYLFTGSLLPSIAASGYATGQAAQGTVCGAVFVAMQVFIHICKEIIMPFIVVITVLGVVDSVSDVSYLKGIVSFLKMILKWGTGLLLTLYGGVLMLQTQTAGMFDSMTGKTLKYTVGSFVPIIGGAVSDSLEMVTSSAKIIKNALGISGILGVLYICAGPLINMCSVALACKISSVVASISAEKKVLRMINEVGGGVARVCINIMAISMMFIISLAMLCRMGGGGL